MLFGNHFAFMRILAWMGRHWKLDVLLAELFQGFLVVLCCSFMCAVHAVFTIDYELRVAFRSVQE